MCGVDALVSESMALHMRRTWNTTTLCIHLAAQSWEWIFADLGDVTKWNYLEVWGYNLNHTTKYFDHFISYQLGWARFDVL